MSITETQGPCIERIDFDEHPAAFDRLKKEGINYIQQMCGDTWTDYNSHDPGITILEQLCFGLTELLYDSDYPVADYLVESDGSLDLERLALHPPEQILTCRPTTLADLREMLLDALGDKVEIDNLWVNVKTDGPVAGLYQVMLQLSAGAMENVGQNRLASAIKTRIFDCWLKVRNLGEDIGDITIVKNKPCQLSCTLDILDEFDPQLVVAQVYDLTADWLERPSIVEQDGDQSLVEDVFNGPALDNAGYLGEPPSADEWLSMAGLRKKLLLIAGVKQVLNISLNLEGQPMTQNCPKTPGLMLQLPPNQRQLDNEITVKRLDVITELDHQVINGHYQQLQSQRDPVLYNRRQINRLYPTPTGRYRQLNHYSPVSHQFPAVYGLDENNQTRLTDDDEKITRKAKANQLDGYLQLFDQVMANFKANLGFIDVLFSSQLSAEPDNQPVQSYGFAPLHGQSAQLAEFDPAIERKNRVLDHLLAMYGESFDQHIQRRFDPQQDPRVLQWQLLLNKTAYLKNIVDMTQARCGGADYSKSCSPFGFGEKLAAHLDMALGDGGAGERTKNSGDSLYVVEHVLLRPMNLDETTEVVDSEFYNFQISILLPGWADRGLNPAFRYAAEQLVQALSPAHLLANVYWLDYDQMTVFEKQWDCWLNLRYQMPYQAVADDEMLCHCEVEPEKPDSQGQNIKQLLQQYQALKVADENNDG